ncbi:LSU ribosomal protein L9p [Halorhodospira halochloris]|uniref:Large ribosomal subunit protein bL9 n=1 Tax=Halorhodospira halochloris TaxID=1052 RepID=A0A110B1G0_HALHR|nr:50S ribosomal protein L9 [Halorhodospira halochloris]MBK1651531.1 50S ribosomal protein L9 [Halorhodospira halochloris]MCG5548742.1 50S ribosomal protein L9 [Halorhodospira halochloris]BAU57205.1 LSU ribosomal protein L9p [Halorhodospira halochloris]
MELILLEKVANLGDLGDRVRVRPGFGRNYLLPYGKAKPATAENIRYFEERRAELEKQAREALEAAQSRLEKLQATPLTIKAKSGEQGKLFGSVAPGDIAAAAEQAGVELAKREVRMPDGPIRVTGEYDVQVQLHTDVVGAVRVVVEGQEP